MISTRRGEGRTSRVSRLLCQLPVLWVLMSSIECNDVNSSDEFSTAFQTSEKNFPNSQKRSNQSVYVNWRHKRSASNTKCARLVLFFELRSVHIQMRFWWSVWKVDRLNFNYKHIDPDERLPEGSFKTSLSKYRKSVLMPKFKSFDCSTHCFCVLFFRLFAGYRLSFAEPSLND